MTCSTTKLSAHGPTPGVWKLSWDKNGSIFSRSTHWFSSTSHSLFVKKFLIWCKDCFFFLFFFSSVSKWTRQHDKRCHTESNQRHIFSFTCFWSIFLYTDFIKKENKYISHPGFIILLHLNKIICCSSFFNSFPNKLITISGRTKSKKGKENSGADFKPKNHRMMTGFVL